MLCGHQGCPNKVHGGTWYPRDLQVRRNAIRTPFTFSAGTFQPRRTAHRTHFPPPISHPIIVAILPPLHLTRRQVYWTSSLRRAIPTPHRLDATVRRFFFFLSLPHSWSSCVKGNPSRQFNGQRPQRHQYPRSGSECMTERRPSSYPYPSRAGETGHCG